jgi:RNA polymerase sigma factor (sigma-70 family)
VTEDEHLSKNIGLIIKLAKSFNPTDTTQLDEYIQLGRIGFLKALRHHDPKRGKLSTLAWMCIRQEILRHIKQDQKHNAASLNNDIPEDKVLVDIHHYLPSSLTPDERRILILRSEGCTFKEIGQQTGGHTRIWINKRYKSAINKVKKLYES